MSAECINIPELRAQIETLTDAGYARPDDAVTLALVEVAEAAKRLLATKPEAIVKGRAYVDFAPGLYALNDAIARLDFGDDA